MIEEDRTQVRRFLGQNINDWSFDKSSESSSPFRSGTRLGFEKFQTGTCSLLSCTAHEAFVVLMLVAMLPCIMVIFEGHCICVEQGFSRSLQTWYYTISFFLIQPFAIRFQSVFGLSRCNCSTTFLRISPTFLSVL